MRVGTVVEAQCRIDGHQAADSPRKTEAGKALLDIGVEVDSGARFLVDIRASG